MVDFKRGVSAKDLRPFSVEDPLGDRRPARASTTRTAPPLSTSPSAHAPSPQSVEPPGQPAAARVARLGCLLMMGIWVMSLVGGAATWLPRVLDQVRPVIERLVAEWERREQGASGVGDPPPSSDPEPAQPPSQAPADPPPDPLAPVPAPSAMPQPSNLPQSDLARACERTVACCLAVQGERARSICENFRRMPTVEPCEESYKVFAQVGRQLGRTCE
jgi:hypothetical protein